MSDISVGDHVTRGAGGTVHWVVEDIYLADGDYLHTTLRSGMTGKRAYGVPLEELSLEAKRVTG